MEKIINLYSKSLLSKLALMAILIVGGGSSAWAERNITISGTGTTSVKFPFYGTLANYTPLRSQYIIPKANLTKVQGESISKIKLYFSGANKSWGDATFKVYLKEVDYTTFSSSEFADWATLTEVYSGSLSIDSKGEMLITFNSSFSYTNDNLLIGFDMQTPGTSNGLSCYGNNSTSNISIYSNYSSYAGKESISRDSFLPKTTIYFTGTAEPTSFSASDITYNSATLGWTAGETETKWQIYYSTTNAEPDGEASLTMVETTPSKTISGLSPETTYYAYVRAYISESNQSDWVSTSFTTLEQYPIPTGLAMSSYTPTTATFAWTNGEGTTPTSWQLRYSTSSSFNPSNDEGTLIDNISTNPYSLSGLTAETTYYASIRACYGGSNYSNWTDKVEFTPSDETEITINDGTTTGGYAPIYGSYTNSITRTQLIIPSSLLTGLRNRQITKLTFYTADESSYKDIDWGVATFEVYIKPINNTSFGSTTLESWGTKVYNSATVSVSNYKMEITLNTPYNYSDGNLMIGFKQTAIGSYKYAKWIGVSGSSNTLLYGYGNNSNNRINFNPQITFTTKSIVTAPVQIDLNGYTTFASPYPLDLTTANLPSGLKAYKAAVDAKNNKVLFTEINQAVPANTGILLGGTAGTTYAIPVAASGTAPEGNAFWVNSTGGTFSAESGYTYYGMKKATSAEDPIVFATFAPGSVAIPSNKAYLQVADTPSGLSRQLVCAFSDNTTTAIAEIANRQNGQNSYFNLAGQRVDGSRLVNGSGLKPGLYIINGKKVVIK
ncbi:MAG: fibronectin type III domain-containing protein [Prevotella sp.]|nr:fibronectin type III domain-containing protein [Prevotella sp.]